MAITAEKAEAKQEKAPPAKNVGQLDHAAVEEISGELRHLLADCFALYLKTKNFHWHMTGKHFRDYHLLLDEQSDQIFAMTDPVAERARKLGGTTLHSISEVSGQQRLKDNNSHHLPPKAMLSELFADNRQLTAFLRDTHELCDRHKDVATASLIEVWIDETERRAWFLGEIIDSLD
jgi:starvation-inducible DNA-binding protein